MKRRFERLIESHHNRGDNRMWRIDTRSHASRCRAIGLMPTTCSALSRNINGKGGGGLHQSCMSLGAREQARRLQPGGRRSGLPIARPSGPTSSVARANHPLDCIGDKELTGAEAVDNPAS